MQGRTLGHEVIAQTSMCLDATHDVEIYLTRHNPLPFASDLDDVKDYWQDDDAPEEQGAIFETMVIVDVENGITEERTTRKIAGV